MKTKTPHINRLLQVVVVAVLCCLVVGTPANADVVSTSGVSYGWPVKPFNRQHPVRGFFGDPRIGETGKTISHSFHFGVDVSCPDGTPVYATLTGRVVLESSLPETVSVVGEDGLVFAYWHVVPSVRNGQLALAYHTIVGHVATGWAHVHFAESHDGVYVNPLRSGAMQPYRDTTYPYLKSLRIEQMGQTLARVPSTGRVDLVIEAYDTTPIPIAAPWHDKPITPAVIRWRLATDHSWRIAFDVRWTIPNRNLYSAVYAAWTRQNNPWGARGRYRFYLAHDVDVRLLGHGVSTIEVQAGDTSGNVTAQRFTVPGLTVSAARVTLAR